MKRSGIAVAGNMIVDILYPIVGNPKPGELTTITDGISRSSGGALCNVIVDLAKLDPTLPLTALGRLGTDNEGDYVLKKLNAYSNIDTSQVRRASLTSFTAVMADAVTKQRTFFHYRGANANFCEEDIDWNNVHADLLHIGYILLLDTLDSPDPVYGTKMAKLLHAAQKQGVKTSIDVVSEACDRFQMIVPPALKYTDYCSINEVEAEASTGIPLRSKTGQLLPDNIPFALNRLKQMGVSTWAVIHCPEGGFGLDEKNTYIHVDRLELPKGYIKGTVGAGDAFSAGILYGAYSGFSLERSIELGTASASCSLSAYDATEGMRSAEDVMRLYHEYKPCSSVEGFDAAAQIKE